MHCVNKVLWVWWVITIIETMKNTYLIGSKERERERSDAKVVSKKCLESILSSLSDY
jgi:hypothetical protein